MAQIPEDLAIVTGADLPTGFDRSTDVLVREPAATGDRQLLMRILRADATPVQADGAAGSLLAYLEKTPVSRRPTTSWHRLVIERTHAVALQFCVMLLPLRVGEAASIVAHRNTAFTISIGA